MYWIILLVGLLFCYAGIRIRRLLLAVQGFTWGVSIAGLIYILQCGSFGLAAMNVLDSSHNSERLIIMVLVAGLILAVLFAALEAFSAFTSTFATIVLLILSLTFLSTGTIGGPILAIAAIIGVIVACLAAKFRLIAFVFSFTIFGGLLSSLGSCGLIYHWNSGIPSYSFPTGTLILLFLLFAVTGFFIQYRYVKHVQGTFQPSTESNVVADHASSSPSSINFAIDLSKIKTTLGKWIAKLRSYFPSQDRKYCWLAVFPFIELCLFPVILSSLSSAFTVVPFVLLIGTLFGSLSYIIFNCSKAIFCLWLLIALLSALMNGFPIGLILIVIVAATVLLMKFLLVPKLHGSSYPKPITISLVSAMTSGIIFALLIILLTIMHILSVNPFVILLEIAVVMLVSFGETLLICKVFDKP